MTETVPCSGATVVPDSQRFQRDTTIQVTFREGKLVRVETKPKNTLEDWPGWE